VASHFKALFVGLLAIALAAPSQAADTPSLVFLGVHFQNDNESLEPNK
jgi:hypothetical protein